MTPDRGPFRVLCALFLSVLAVLLGAACLIGWWLS